MKIKAIGILAISAVLAMSPVVRADDDFDQDFADFVESDEYEDYEVFEDVTDLIDEELVEPVEVAVEPELEIVSSESEPVSQTTEVVEAPAPRMVSGRLSCDEIATRVAELSADVKAYPELKTDLENMLARQRNQCAPRAARRPVHNYRNVNPIVDFEVPEPEPEEVTPEPTEPQKTPEEIAAEEAAAEAERQAKIAENLANGLCGDGTKPNNYGCCDGEVFKQIEHLEFACCPKDGDGECREPFKKS